MSPNAERAPALWQAYDLAVIESKRAEAVAAQTAHQPRPKGSRVLTLEQLSTPPWMVVTFRV
ncbi:MAG TPA: hypothetical protein VM597_13890 [Gemmataceae bacterium]|jgi:hypothetical protein|nr:hypothetical protein [Gemmataceae bacterium]